MTRFAKRVFVFGIIILAGLFVLSYVSKNGAPTFGEKEENVDFSSESGFLSPGTELK